MNEKIKILIIFIAAIAFGLLAFMGGYRSNRSGIQSDNGRIDELGVTIKQSKQRDSDIEQNNIKLDDNIDKLQGSVSNIESNNESAVKSVRTAKDILRAAKRRTEE